MIIMYVNNAHRFADRILSGEKTVETRTLRSFQDAARHGGLHIGDRIGIASGGKLVGFVTIADVVVYADEDAFRADFSRHLVPAGSAFDFDAKKGKVGLVLDEPYRLLYPLHLPKATRPTGWVSYTQEEIETYNRIPHM